MLRRLKHLIFVTTIFSYFEDWRSLMESWISLSILEYVHYICVKKNGKLKGQSILQDDTSWSFCSDLAKTPTPGKCILPCRQGELVFLRAYITNTLPYLNGQSDRYGAPGRPVSAKHDHMGVREYHRLKLNEHHDGTSQVDTSQVRCPEYTKNPDTCRVRSDKPPKFEAEVGQEQQRPAMRGRHNWLVNC